MDEDEEKQQIKNDLQTMEMVLKEYLIFLKRSMLKELRQ